MKHMQSILLVLLMATLGVAAVNLALTISSQSSTYEPVMALPVNEEIEMDDEEELILVEEEPAVSSFTYRGLSFEYPTGWHIFQQAFFDNPDRIRPELRVFLNPDPIRVVSPSGGPSLATRIEFESLDEGEAYLSFYESDAWETFEKDTVMVNGEEVERIRVTANPDEPYTPPSIEAVFLFADNVAYEVRYYSHDSDYDADWEMILESLSLESFE